MENWNMTENFDVVEYGMENGMMKVVILFMN